MGVSKNRGTPNGWFLTENFMKMDNFGVPLCSETPISPSNTQVEHVEPHSIPNHCESEP